MTEHKPDNMLFMPLQYSSQFRSSNLTLL